MEAGGERARSWYLSGEEVERGSPSRRDGVGAAKEAELRATYCSFIGDVGIGLRLPQITIATAIVLCHRFYLHQSHAKNEWQIEDTPCPLKRVVVVAYETMYRKDPDAARRIQHKEVLEKQKALILVGETLLLSTIRFDFNIQHPYEPLKLALNNLGVSQKEVKQVAVNLVNDTLRTTLVVQFKPHYIAAGSLFLAAKFHNIRLPSEKGKIWWHEFDVAPKQLQAVIQQMTELFMKRKEVRNPCSMAMGPPFKPTPTPAPMEKQHIISTPDPVPRHTHSSERNFDREASRNAPVYSLANHNSTGSSARNEHNQSLRTRMDRSLSSTAMMDERLEKQSSFWDRMDRSLSSTAMMDERLEKQSSRAALKVNHVYNVCSGPKDINVTRIRNLITNKRRIQEFGEHPAPIDKSDKGAWIGRQHRSVIVVKTKSSSWKKQKL